jgi:hypothetical protein
MFIELRELTAGRAGIVVHSWDSHDCPETTAVYDHTEKEEYEDQTVIKQKGKPVQTAYLLFSGFLFSDLCIF